MGDTIINGYSTFQKRSTDTTIDLQSIPFPKPVPVHSFFTSHELKAAGLKAEPFTRFQPDWILALLLFCFALIAWVRVFANLRMNQVMKTPFARRFVNQLTREGNLFSERISLALGTVYTLSFILLLYMGYEMLVRLHYPLGLNSFTFYLVLGAGLLLFWTIKVLLIRFLSSVFRTRQTTREYLLNILIFNLIAGVLLLPVLVLTVYLKSYFFLYTGIGIIVLMYIFRFFRGFVIGISLTKFSYLFLFLYLCTLEILPLVVLLKLFLIYYRYADHI